MDIIQNIKDSHYKKLLNKIAIFLYYQKPLIGVKGRVQTKTVEADGKKINEMEIISEKVTLLSSHSKEDSKEE